MQYTLLFGLTPEEFEARSDPEKQQSFYAAFLPYVKAIRDAGIFVSGVGLQPPSSATTVRRKDGRRLVQDGPFADTKEQLGGFVIIEVPDLNSALEWAARYPAGEGGLVEVRPNLPTAAPAGAGAR
jgi:hypothetical protein